VNSYATDSDAQELIVQLALASPNEQGFQFHQGVIKKGSQIWVGNNSALKMKIIHALHNTAVGDILEFREHMSELRSILCGEV
jgi:hypothetical protein